MTVRRKVDGGGGNNVMISPSVMNRQRNGV
jgi:hypothetical protein